MGGWRRGCAVRELVLAIAMIGCAVGGGAAVAGCNGAHGTTTDAGRPVGSLDGGHADRGDAGGEDADCCPFDAALAADGGWAPRDAASGDAGPRDARVEDASAGVADAGRRDAGGGGCASWTGGRPIRALFVGNSQIVFWDLPRLVSSLSASAPAACPRIVGEGFALGGANLRDLWEETLPDGRRLPDVIATGGYDVIVIAESIDLAELVPAPFPALFVDYARRIVAAARAAGAVPILYATPYVERPDPSPGFHAMADPQIALGRELGVRVATGGLAWLRVWVELPGIDLYWVDRQHPGFPGSYVSALVIYSTITGASPIGLTRAPATTCEGSCPAISAAEADVFQRAAWDEVRARTPSP